MKFTCLVILSAFPLLAENWPQWRGPYLDGRSGEKNLPTKWSATENVAWKLEMPAWSGATPIIWGQHVFLNMAEGDGLSLWAVNKKDGTVLWKRPMGGGNVKMRKQNMSSPSPVTDGKTVWALTGTGVLKAFDFAGKELWARDIQKDYGAFGLNHGYASSPLLHEGSLYVQVLHGMKTDEPSYVLKIDGKSGKTIWRVERPTAAVSESPDSYATPTLLRNGKELELVVLGGDCITGHDLTTGKELWRGGGLNPDNNPFYRMIASPVVFEGVVYAPTRVKPMTAFKGGGRGDITTSHRLWQFQSGPDVPTPVTDGKYLYVVRDNGAMYCLDAKTGAEIYGGKRLRAGTYSASPTLADGKIYITSEEGVASVVKAGPEFEVLAENAMNEYTLSTIAVSDGQLFLRTDKFLYAIGKATR
ncbi:MAG: PQQ-binding-like beta-propeller repeat protein [Bryobacteraceae bacterium]|nr:PQQ-binding-like beta-propeller repeat protein [Bryobacteraceae bacterium]